MNRIHQSVRHRKPGGDSILSPDFISDIQTGATLTHTATQQYNYKRTEFTTVMQEYLLTESANSLASVRIIHDQFEVETPLGTGAWSLVKTIVGCVVIGWAWSQSNIGSQCIHSIIFQRQLQGTFSINNLLNLCQVLGLIKQKLKIT